MRVRIRLCDILSILLLGIAVELLMGAPWLRADQENVPPTLSPKRLLIQGYILGTRFVPEERAFLYVRLGEAATEIQPELATLLAEEVFDLTLQLPRTHNRLAMQKNAVLSLAKVDPDRAFELFERIDLPYPGSDGYVTEDVRADGARKLFAELWRRRGPGALEKLRAQAQHLGNTGQYPYLAMAPIISDVARSSPLLAQSLFTEAVESYGRGDRVRLSDQEFASFVRQMWEVVPRPSSVEALRILVERLLRRTKTPTNETVLMRAYTEKGVSQFHSSEDFLLFELLPLIRQTDPEWARRIVEGRPALAEAPPMASSSGRMEGVVIRGRASPAELSAMTNRGMERSRLHDIEETAQNDPETTLGLSMSLTSPDIRSVALSRVALALSSSADARAREVADQAKNLIDGIQDKGGKVRALVALAETAANIGDSKTFRESVKKAFDLGTEIFQQDLDVHPGKAAIFATGFDDLARLTAVAVRFDRDTTLQYLASLRNEQLRAHLLVDAALTLHKLQTAEKARTN